MEVLSQIKESDGKKGDVRWNRRRTILLSMVIVMLCINWNKRPARVPKQRPQGQVDIKRLQEGQVVAQFLPSMAGSLTGYSGSVQCSKAD